MRLALGIVCVAAVLTACSGTDTPAGSDRDSATAAAMNTASAPGSAGASPSKSQWPKVFPADYPFPPNLSVTEQRDEAATGLVAGTVPLRAEDCMQFYDSRMPGLGWKLDETTSSGGAHVYTRGALSTTIVCAAAPTIQLTISKTS